MNWSKILFLTLCIATIGLGLGRAHAQTVPITLSGFELNFSPSNPAPGQSVTITAVSYTFDVNSATFTWKINGAQIKKGIGQNSITTIAPAASKSANIQVTAVTSNGQTYYQTASLRPAAIDLIMEHTGYTPPFFQGKIPLSYQNGVKIIAIPHITDSTGKEYDPTTLVYKWKKDSGTVFNDQSGYGKQYISLEGALVPRPYSVTVEVSTKDGGAGSRATISIDPQSPFLSFFVSDPLYGALYNKAVNETVYIGQQKESGVIAVPFGFNKPVTGWGDIAATWSINGVAHPELSPNSTIILRAPEGTAGTSNVSLRLRNTKDILQGTLGSFIVQFNGSASTNSQTSGL